MANLRDKGYPSSARTTPVRSRSPRKVSGTGEGLFKREIPVDYSAGSPWATSRPRMEIDPLLNDKQEAYVNVVNSALNASRSPLHINHSANYRQVDHNWDNQVDRYNSVNLPDDTRLAYTHSIDNLNPEQPDYYGAGIDNLDAILGENYYTKTYQLPFNMSADIEYDGDGTLAGGLNVPSKQYYVAALMNLLNKR